MKEDSNLVREANGSYRIESEVVSEEEILKAAEEIMDHRFMRGMMLKSPDDTKRFLKVKLSTSEQEVFSMLFLDNRHRVISFDSLFYGTIDNAVVYPREVVKAVVNHNAAAVILAHCHPSGGSPHASDADRRLTTRLTTILSLIDVRILDHMIVSGTAVMSFAEQGLL